MVEYASPREGSRSLATCRAEALPWRRTLPRTAASRSPSSMDLEMIRASLDISFYPCRNSLRETRLRNQARDDHCNCEKRVIAISMLTTVRLGFGQILLR